MKKDKLVLVIIILLLVSSFILITIGESYSFFTYSKDGQTKNKLIVGRHDATGLAAAILANNDLITDTPNLNTASTTCSTTTNSNGVSTTTCSEDDPGLYVSTNTNDGSATYYFRGNVENNYVSFAGKTWRIVRINEDGTVRIVMQSNISDVRVTYGSYSNTDVNYIYYSNSNAKTVLETWYTTNIENNYNYSSRVATGDYFCEQAKVSSNSTDVAGMLVYSSYTPNFKCKEDTNGYGIINASVGLLTYDEVVYAGGYPNITNDDFYLIISNNTSGDELQDASNLNIWTMSPAGFSSNPTAWAISNSGNFRGIATYSNGGYALPVINLKADVEVVGSGLESDMYIVQ